MRACSCCGGATTDRCVGCLDPLCERCADAEGDGEQCPMCTTKPSTIFVPLELSDQPANFQPQLELSAALMYHGESRDDV